MNTAFQQNQRGNGNDYALKIGNCITCYQTQRHGLCSSLLTLLVSWSSLTYSLYLPFMERNVMCPIRSNGCNNHRLTGGKFMKCLCFQINQKAKLEPQNNTQKIALLLPFSCSLSLSCIFFNESFVNQRKSQRVKMRQLQIEELMQKKNRMFQLK